MQVWYFNFYHFIFDSSCLSVSWQLHVGTHVDHPDTVNLEMTKFGEFSDSI